jgi:hypothetical protein
VAESIVIPRRFNGPPDSGHGGYSCGAVASLVGNPVEVTLLSPPPLETPLVVERPDGEVRVRDGDTLVAEGVPVELDLEVPDPVSLEEAVRGNREGHRLFTPGHPFPTCIVCGPDREKADGMGVMAGPVREGLFAADWTADDSVSDGAGVVSTECVWAMLDCPSSGKDGRKRHAGSAIFTAGGDLLAAARATWIELRP